MSGGSFNYLYCKTLSETMGSIGDLREMVELLEKEFPYSPATIDTRAIYDVLRRMEDAWDEPDGEVQRLAKVWHAVEWWQSNDWGINSVEAHVAGYRPVEDRRIMYQHQLPCRSCNATAAVVQDPDGQWFVEDHPVAGEISAPLCVDSGRPLSRKASGQWQ